jgi:putative transposase
MASRPRRSRSDLLKSTGEFFHAYNRGVDRQLLFHERDDYLVFLDLMEKWHRPYDLVVHTFQLMPNHHHSILQQLVPYAMSEFEKHINQGLAQWVNRHSKRVGHLFQGRYKFKHIDDPNYLARLARYIHQNPVAAGLVKTPEEWEFGSGKDFLKDNRFGFLTRDTMFSLAGGREKFVEFSLISTPDYDEGIERFLIEKPLG